MNISGALHLSVNFIHTDIKFHNKKTLQFVATMSTEVLMRSVKEEINSAASAAPILADILACITTMSNEQI